jgi:hypothetical protein
VAGRRVCRENQEFRDGRGLPVFRSARLKDWRRIATRYERCPDLFLSACALATVVPFWS